MNLLVTCIPVTSANNSYSLESADDNCPPPPAEFTSFHHVYMCTREIFPFYSNYSCIVIPSTYFVLMKDQMTLSTVWYSLVSLGSKFNATSASKQQLSTHITYTMGQCIRERHRSSRGLTCIPATSASKQLSSKVTSKKSMKFKRYPIL